MKKSVKKIYDKLVTPSIKKPLEKTVKKNKWKSNSTSNSARLTAHLIPPTTKSLGWLVKIIQTVPVTPNILPNSGKYKWGEKRLNNNELTKNFLMEQ